ncbi:MAG: flagellar hook-length control protein FliK [Eubacteriales bacterium]
MNTIAIISMLNIGNKTVQSQPQQVGETSGFLDLISSLLSGLSGSDSQSQIINGEPEENAPEISDPVMSQETEPSILAAQSMVSALHIIQPNPTIEITVPPDGGGTQATDAMSMIGKSDYSVRNTPQSFVDNNMLPDNTAQSIMDDGKAREVRPDFRQEMIEPITTGAENVHAPPSGVPQNIGSDIIGKRSTLMSDKPSVNQADIKQSAQDTSSSTFNIVLRETSGASDKSQPEERQASGDIQRGSVEKGETAEIEKTADGMPAFKIIQNELSVNTIEKTEKVIPSDEVKNSVASQISTQALDSLKKGQSDFKLILKPDGLGEIEVKMTLDSSGLSMKINTELASTQKLISAQLPQLRQELTAGEQILTSLGVELRQNAFTSQQFNAYGRQSRQQADNTQAAAGYIKADDRASESYIPAQQSYGSRIYYRI